MREAYVEVRRALRDEPTAALAAGCAQLGVELTVPPRSSPSPCGAADGARPNSSSAGHGRSQARERLLSTASGLFYREGIRAVGVERILAEAPATRATFYRHFPSKEDLVVAYLRGVDADIRAGTEAAVEAAASARGHLSQVTGRLFTP